MSQVHQPRALIAPGAVATTGAYLIGPIAGCGREAGTEWRPRLLVVALLAVFALLATVDTARRSQASALHQGVAHREARSAYPGA